MTDRGQAELVGYVLVFSAIVLTVGLVTISGQAGLVDLRDSQRTASVETGFSVLADNVDDIVQRGVPSRATELGLAGGSLSLGDPVTVTVTHDSAGDIFERSLRPVVYDAPSGTTLVYTTGAVVISGNEGGSVMLREPQLLLGPSRTIVPLVNTSLDRQPGRNVSEGVQGDTRVLVRTERIPPTSTASTDRDGDLTITVNSPRASAWRTYLEREIDPDTENCPGEDPTSVSCTYTTERTTVILTRVGLTFE